MMSLAYTRYQFKHKASFKIEMHSYPVGAIQSATSSAKSFSSSLAPWKCNKNAFKAYIQIYYAKTTNVSIQKLVLAWRVMVRGSFWIKNQWKNLKIFIFYYCNDFVVEIGVYANIHIFKEPCASYLLSQV